MPDMQLRSPIFENLYPWGLAALKVYMLAPSDQKKRSILNVNDATHMLEQLHEIGKIRQDNELRASIWSCITDQFKDLTNELVFNPNGGWESARKIGELEELSTLPLSEWRTAAFIIGVIRSISDYHPNVRGGASLNKAYTAALAHHSEYRLCTNHLYIKQAWKKYKSVSHLCAAFFEPIVFKSNLEGEDFLLFLLSIANNYQNFITSFRAHPGNQDLVSETEIWAIPKEIVLPNIESQKFVTPLPPSILKTIENYQAPL